MPSLENRLSLLATRDSAGLVRDRISGSTLADLHRWFEDPDGGASGGVLLERMPILDATLEKLLHVSDEDNGAPGRAGAHRLFSAGLLVGAALVAPEGAATPFPPTMTIDDALDQLEAQGLPPELADESGTYFQEDPREALVAVMREDRALEHVILSCYRMAVPSMHCRHDSQPLRLLFLAGLVGAGVLPPTDKSSDDALGPEV